MDILTLVETYGPVVFALAIGYFSGAYRKAKKLVNAFSKALEDDRITPEELEEFIRIFKEG